MSVELSRTERAAVKRLEADLQAWIAERHVDATFADEYTLNIVQTEAIGRVLDIARGLGFRRAGEHVIGVRAHFRYACPGRSLGDHLGSIAVLVEDGYSERCDFASEDPDADCPRHPENALARTQLAIDLSLSSSLAATLAELHA